MPRLKPARKIKSLEETNNAIMDIAQLEIHLENIDVKATEKITLIKKNAANKKEALRKRIADLRHMVGAYWNRTIMSIFMLEKHTEEDAKILNKILKILCKLTIREHCIFLHILVGYTPKQMAKIMNIKISTFHILHKNTIVNIRKHFNEKELKELL